MYDGMGIIYILRSIAKVRRFFRNVLVIILLTLLLLTGCVKQVDGNSGKTTASATVVKGEWAQAYFRGTPNNWGTTLMKKVAPNTWEIIITFNNGDGYGVPRFKIDHYGDWSESYPESDYEVESYTTYKITFYDNTHYIEVKKYTSPINGVMLQGFQWYLPEYDETTQRGLWVELSEKIPELSSMGVTALWLPPAYKGQAGKSDVGYGVYDMYDLGEFNQKGSIATKYGTKDQYLNVINSAHLYNMQIYADVVFNHRMGQMPQNGLMQPKFHGMTEIWSLKIEISKHGLFLISQEEEINTLISNGDGIILMEWIGIKVLRKAQYLDLME